MANTDAPFGLRPVRYLNGVCWNGQARPYYVPSSDSTALFKGDPVVIVGDSNDNEVTVIGGKFAPGTLSEVTRATAGDGNYITGVVVGVAPTTDESLTYRAASTERVVWVADDPNIVFHMQDDGGGTPSADWVGWNANLIAGTGSTATGISGFELDGGTSDGPANDASNQLFILNLANVEDNEIGDNAIWEVTINMHTYRATGDGDGSLGVS